MKDFRDFKVWEKAHALVLAIYKATEAFPRHECSGWRANCVGAAHLFRPTLPKVAAGSGILSCIAFCRFLAVPQTKWNITCCCLRTSGTCPNQNTPYWIDNSPKWSECLSPLHARSDLSEERD